MNSLRPFRFGIQVKEMPDGRTWIDTVRKCEGLGVSVVTLADHFDGAFSAFPALSAAAAATTDLRFGTMVLGNDYRHPVITARDAATVAIVSDNRFELGLGAGWLTLDYEGAGLTLDRPGVRIARLREACLVIRSLLDTGACDFDGEHYQVHLDGQLSPSGRVPLLLGGGGPRMLGIAGELADIVGINVALPSGVFDEAAGADATWDRTVAKINAVRSGADGAGGPVGGTGSRFDEIEFQTRVHLAAVTDDREGLAQLAPSFGLEPDEALRSPHALLGTIDQIADQLIAQRETLGISYIGLNLDVLDDLAPLIARLAGT